MRPFPSNRRPHASRSGSVGRRQRIVVQTWRAAKWPAAAPDSVLVLIFDERPVGSSVSLIQVNFPPGEFDTNDRGWHSNYWEPWRAYLDSEDPGSTRQD